MVDEHDEDVEPSKEDSVGMEETVSAWKKSHAIILFACAEGDPAQVGTDLSGDGSTRSHSSLGGWPYARQPRPIHAPRALRHRGRRWRCGRAHSRAAWLGSTRTISPPRPLTATAM